MGDGVISQAQAAGEMVALGTLGVGREDEAMRWRRSHQIGDSADRGISES